MLPEEVHVHPGSDVEALQVGHADHVAEVAVALLVPAEEDQVAALGVQPVDLVRAPPPGRGHIDLTADDGLDPLPLAGPVEVHRAVHHAVVRDGHGALPQLPHPLGQTVDAAEAVQEAVLGVDVEMDKAHGQFLLFLLPAAQLHQLAQAVAEAALGDGRVELLRKLPQGQLRVGLPQDNGLLQGGGQVLHPAQGVELPDGL